MPVLVIDNMIQGRSPKCRISGPCEWCGEHLTEDECRPVFSIPDYQRPPGVDAMAILTRMCQECIDIYALLGRDGICENGENDGSHQV